MRVVIVFFSVLVRAAWCDSPEPGLAAEAERKLFNAQYEAAAEAYTQLLKAKPADGFAYDRLVRSLLAAHANQRAYAAAEGGGSDCPRDCAGADSARPSGVS